MTATDRETENPYLAELRAQYAQNDASMSEEMKQQYPILDYNQIWERYPDECIAFVAVEPMFRDRDAKGRVVVHAHDSEGFDELVLAFHAEYPELPLSTMYTVEAKMSFIDAIL